MYRRNSNAFPFELSIKFLDERLDLHTTPTICEECGGSIKRVKGNGISTKKITERNSRDKPAAFINILEKLTFTGPYLTNAPKAN